MSASCGHGPTTFDGMSDAYRRRLWVVIAINAAMFVTEMSAGHLAGSKALQADALDFFADAITYGISLAVIGRAQSLRSLAAAAKGFSLLAMGFWVFTTTVWQVFHAAVPQAPVMGIIGFLALCANLASVLILVRYKDGDANVRSVWLCSRNDAIGNILVLLAALSVWASHSAWPDLIVAAIMASLFISSAFQILRQSINEWRSSQTLKAACAERPHHTGCAAVEADHSDGTSSCGDRHADI